MSSLNFPRLLWNWYHEYLWDYQQGSWVYSSSKFFRGMAFVAIVPFALFIMLDIASYIIARTLGVIDDTKASTSDQGSVVEIYNTNENPGNATTPTIVIQTDPTSVPIPDDGDDLAQAPQPFGDGNLKLSGYGVFSPAASRPASPVWERKRLPSRSLGESEVEDEAAIGEGDESTEESLGREPSWGSLSVESSYTMIDKDGSEDPGSPASVRRRPKHGNMSMTPAS